MLSKANCLNVEPINVNFLTVEPNDPKYSAATHILLDPSCSGSGIVNRLDHLLETKENDDTGQLERLTKLSNFQLTIIRHAMKFPLVTKIVYSTCSIHAMENEVLYFRYFRRFIDDIRSLACRTGSTQKHRVTGGQFQTRAKAGCFADMASTRPGRGDG